jgi:hypothetical protein
LRRKTWRVDDTTTRLGQSKDCVHITLFEGEVKDVEVFSNVFFSLRSGKCDHVFLLDEPPQNNLRNGLAMPPGYALQGGFRKHSSDCHRAIGGNGQSGLLGGRDETRLVEVWVLFKLICCQWDVRQVDSAL